MQCNHGWAWKSGLFAVVCFLRGAGAEAKPKAEPKAKPSVVRLSLAGQRLAVGEADFLKCDPKAGYFLHRSGEGWEGLGCHLELCSREYFLAKSIFRDDAAKAERTTLPNLKTGWGVNIGDSPAVVRRKLGALPTKQSWDRDKKSSFLNYLYHKSVFLTIPISAYKYQKPPVTNKRLVRKKFDYSAEYTFANNQLVRIAYRVSDPDFEC